MSRAKRRKQRKRSTYSMERLTPAIKPVPEVEHAHTENQYSQKAKSPHFRSTTTTNTQQSSESKDNHASSAIIYASSNGQIDAPHSSPHQAWELSYLHATPTSEAQNDSNDRSFAQQVCTNLNFALSQSSDNRSKDRNNFSNFIIKLFFRIGLATLLFQTNKGMQLKSNCTVGCNY